MHRVGGTPCQAAAARTQPRGSRRRQAPPPCCPHTCPRAGASCPTDAPELVPCPSAPRSLRQQGGGQPAGRPVLTPAPPPPGPFANKVAGSPPADQSYPVFTQQEFERATAATQVVAGGTPGHTHMETKRSQGCRVTAAHAPQPPHAAAAAFSHCCPCSQATASAVKAAQAQPLSASSKQALGHDAAYVQALQGLYAGEGKGNFGLQVYTPGVQHVLAQRHNCCSCPQHSGSCSGYVRVYERGEGSLVACW